MNSKFVSRSGEKLDYALDEFKIDVSDMICADFGSSKGGFVDCLLKKGAKKVYAIDVGYGELDWNLRNNPKVIVMERTNALNVKLPEKMDFISIDVGWTKQKLIIPNALKNLKKNGIIIPLIKPHYEAEKNQLKSGKVKDEYLDEIIEKVRNDILEVGGVVKEIIESPIIGRKGGNREFLAWIIKK
jgi:23S rRNA (cytidine1920-2'-O)/16S rRNA (cytidine1409-2'-O)-methyltransferase